MVYTDVKKQKQRLRAKQGNGKETYWYKACVPPNTVTKNRVQI